MHRIAILAILLLVHTSAFAQLTPTPRTLQQVTDPAMVIEDRGSTLEVLPTMRAARQRTLSGQAGISSIFTANASEPIGPQQLGMVFNHAMQVQGFITGEIAFKMKGGLQATDRLDRAAYPGLAKLTNPNLYLVVAGTPSEFVELVKRLQARPDVEWVEPVVTYGAPSPSPSAR